MNCGRFALKSIQSNGDSPEVKAVSPDCLRCFAETPFRFRLHATSLASIRIWRPLVAKEQSDCFAGVTVAKSHKNLCSTFSVSVHGPDSQRHLNLRCVVGKQ